MSAEELRASTSTRLLARPLTPAIGAEIENVDLSQPLSDELFEQIQQALLTYGVIFFRDQPLDPRHLYNFARRFGELDTGGILPKVDGLPGVTVSHNDRDRRPVLNIWHTDSTYVAVPPMGVVLYCDRAPPVGGDTIWASMYAAYDALPAQMKALLADLVAVHETSYEAYLKSVGDKVKVDLGGGARVRSAEHPVVRTHPVTGRKCLFVNSGLTKYIKGLKPIESDTLLGMLYRHCELPEFQVRFRWRARSLAMWDNRCTQHYGVADYWPQERLMYRAPIKGDIPY